MGKRLGQHFLIHKPTLSVIGTALAASRGEVVIEIGPGHGELTHYLLEAGYLVLALERDVNLVRHLRNRFQGSALTIIEGDALHVLPDIAKRYQLKTNSYSLVGNIPYYITGHLLRILGELDQYPRTIVLMVQKEVAQRVCAKPPAMNLLAASVSYWADVKYVKTVPKRFFSPAPKVDSALIRLTPKEVERARWKEKSKTYYRFIKALFRQPRKTILNNLAGADLRGRYADLRGRKENIMERLQKVGINPNDRPQNLSVEQIQALSTLF